MQKKSQEIPERRYGTLKDGKIHLGLIRFRTVTQGKVTKRLTKKYFLLYRRINAPFNLFIIYHIYISFKKLFINFDTH